jgi:CHASE3 domain sensor protein
MNNETRPNSEEFADTKPKNNAGTWTEQIEIASSRLSEEVTRLLHEGNVRTVRIKHQGKLMVEVPLTVAAVSGGIATIIAPYLTLIVAIAGIFARVTIEVERVPEPEKTKNNLEDVPAGKL